jgi:hypothetical protein
MFSVKGTGAAWNGYIWVATGHGTTNTIATSRDGITWIPCPTSTLFSVGANSVVWNDDVAMWVAVGEGSANTIATSYDGYTWTGRGKNVFSIRGNNVSLCGTNPAEYIVTGQGGSFYGTYNNMMGTWPTHLFRSTNGINWTPWIVNQFTGYGTAWDNRTLGKNTKMVADINNSWIRSLKLSRSDYALGNYRGTYSWSTITGVEPVGSDILTIVNEAMGTIKITPVNPGLGTGYANGVIIKIPNGTYTRGALITAINNGLNYNNIAAGSLMTVFKSSTGDEYIQIRLDVSKVYTATDYKIVFYDQFSFSTMNMGMNIGNTSWDSTLGWILGFRKQTEYNLSSVVQTGIIRSITGDTVVSVNIYSNFMILVDDFTNSHVNSIVTTTKQDTMIDYPSYTNLAQFNSDPLTGNLIANTVSASGSVLTQKQVYAIQASLDQQRAQTTAIKLSDGPTATNVFALIPLNISNLTNNQKYTREGIDLHDQRRGYFGPVNISRLAVKLINDRGEIVDLNGEDWSFTFICEQAYTTP